MSKIEKKDLRKVSYEEFGRMLEELEHAVRRYMDEHDFQFDLIVPILRSGAFPAMHLASRLNVTSILPVQYKYLYAPAEHIEKKMELPKLLTPIAPTAHILIVDTNTMSAGIAKRVIADIHEAFPQATLYFASVCLDQSMTALEHVAHIFSARMSNERRQLTTTEAEARGISNDVLIFPWEDLNEQWRDIQTFSA